MEDELLKPSKLCEITGLRASTLKYWSESGLLKYEQGGKRLMKRYPKKKTLDRIKEIKKLKKEGKTIAEIIMEYYA